MTTPPATSIFLRVDPVEVLERFAAELEKHAEATATAVREGRARDALLAAGAMQALMAAWKDRLTDALAQTRSKRVPPAVRAAARQAARQVLPAVYEPMRELAARLKVHKARQAAIGAALRAASTAPAMSYGASARYGVRVQSRTVRHALAVTV